MSTIKFQGQTLKCRKKETVLDAFLRNGINAPFSCRNGICHVCMQRCTNGPIPPAANRQLKDHLRLNGYFLPCKCVPNGDMSVEPPLDADLYTPAIVNAKEVLSPDICRLLIEPATPLKYRPGQFINLRRADGLCRSYSLASVAGDDYFIELHVKRKTNGAMSNWIFDELAVDSEIDIQGPFGECTYVPGYPDQNLLLICTGTGLAPLTGIARDALRQGHTGQIFLYHGSHDQNGQYLSGALDELARAHPNFNHSGCVSGDIAGHGQLQGRAHEIALQRHMELDNWRVYLSGLPVMVHAAEKMAIAAGAHASQVHADPFEMTDLRQAQRITDETPSAAAAEKNKRRYPTTDPEMWNALRQGEGLNEILHDFYTRVYEDPRLLPFFHGITKQRSIEKQYLFLRQIFTGEKVYFGDRPRNAHHWMVISGELFDYREGIMKSCLARYGLADDLIRRWIAVENSFRNDIVKSAPFSKVMNGVELPLDGFGEAILEVGTLCDGCGREINPPEKVSYHLRLGNTYCASCSTDKAVPALVGT